MVTLHLTREEAQWIMYESAYLIVQIDRIIGNISSRGESPDRTSSIEHYTKRRRALEKVKNLLASEIYGAKSTTDLTPTPTPAKL